jgi:hypothetical protein
MGKKRKRFGLLILIVVIICLLLLLRTHPLVSPLPEQHGIMLELISPSLAK